MIFAGCNQVAMTSDTRVLQWWTKLDREHILSELRRTTEELKFEISDLTQSQWDFKEAEDRWSIGEIVEHLEMQNQLHFREIAVTSKAPQYLQFRSITEGQDQYFTNYATDSVAGKAQWFLEPLGRFPTRERGLAAFLRARSAVSTFVSETKIDLRKQFTFRTEVEGKDLSKLIIGQVRDLHQLLLTGIAHTDRHLQQIRNIKQHHSFPKFVKAE